MKLSQLGLYLLLIASGFVLGFLAVYIALVLLNPSYHIY